MILPFSTQLNGKPTYFPQKIWRSINKIYDLRSFIDVMPLKYFAPYELREKHQPKKHTIREDKKNRWKPGVMIDFFINTRTKDMFRFAPRIPVVSTQKIEIFQNSTTWIRDGFVIPAVYIDGYNMSYDVIESLSKNDGFDSIEEFFEYFNADFSGKIIHWTDLKY